MVKLWYIRLRCYVFLLQGLKEPPASETEEQEIYILATRWRGGLEKHRHAEITYSDINDLGLRVVAKNNDGPHLAEMCHPVGS